MYSFSPLRSLWLTPVSVVMLIFSGVVLSLSRRQLTPPLVLALLLLVSVFTLMSLLIGLYLAGVRQWRRGEPSGILLCLSRPANSLTLIRVFLVVVGTTIAVAASQNGEPSELVLLGFGFIVLGFLGDLIDGVIARMEVSPILPGGTTNHQNSEDSPSPSLAREVGPWLDAEGDAFAIFVAGIGMYMLNKMGLTHPQMSDTLSLIIIPISARYLFGLMFTFLPWREKYPRWYRLFSKTAAALLQVSLVGSWFTLLVPQAWLLNLTQALLLSSGLVIGISFFLELVFRIRGTLKLFPRPYRRGLVRSYIIYYLLPFTLMPWRYLRMEHHYRQFISGRALVFDVGSHIGSRIAVFYNLGADVVAFEPQEACLPLLNHLYQGLPGVKIIPVALGSEDAYLQLHQSPIHPTLSSIDPDWVNRRRSDTRFRSVAWKKTTRVPVIPADHAIQQHGTPRFIKIDVEGAELQVLKGLTYRPEALSFEYLQGEVTQAIACISLLEEAGPWQYNFSPGEQMRLRWSTWITAESLVRLLTEIGSSLPGGDIYARRT